MRSIGERGSVSVLSAAVLFLAAVLALVTVDIARVVRTEGRAQTAADAAALAAAQEIALPSGRSPLEVAAEYAGRNGGTLVSCRCEPGTSEAVVAVSVQASLLFLGPDRAIERQARAVVEILQGPP
jgi:secretion/DNA translocation related TadE-like protein